MTSFCLSGVIPEQSRYVAKVEISATITRLSKYGNSNDVILSHSGVVPEPSREVAKAGESGALGVAAAMFPPGSTRLSPGPLPFPLLHRPPVTPPGGQNGPVSMATAPHAHAAPSASAVWNLGQPAPHVCRYGGFDWLTG